MRHNKNPHNGNYSFVLTDVRNCSSYIPQTETFLEIGTQNFLLCLIPPRQVMRAAIKKKVLCFPCHFSFHQLESVKTKQLLKNYISAKQNSHAIILVQCKITGLTLITTAEYNEAEINLEECLNFQYCTLPLSLPIP